MADKDIRLVIRAKNEANRAINSVSDALKELVAINGKTEESADKVDTVIGKLGREFKKLSAEVSGLSALGKVSAQMERAAGAMDRLQKEAHDASAEFERVSKEAQAAARATESLRQKQSQLTATQTNLKTSVAASKKEMQEANRELKAAEKALERVATASKKHQSSTPWSNAAASAQTLAEGAVESARQNADEATKAYQRLSGELKTLGQDLKSTGTELRNAAKHEQDLTDKTQKLAEASQKSADAVTRGKQELKEIQGVASEAASKLGGVAISQEKITQATAEANAALGRTKALQEAMARYSDGGGGFTDPESAAAFRRQRAEVERAQEAYRTLDAEAKRLSAALDGTVAPTDRQTRALREVQAAAAAAGKELKQQRAILQQMPGAYNRVRSGAGAFESVYGASRKAMSLTQRLRGEVLSLTTAYFGLYAAANQVGSVISAYQKLEATTSRLGAVMEQNQSAIRKELRWLERQASRLGIEFGTLADEYSKFSVAASAANFQGDSTRKIFLSVAEAARVNKLSMEQTSGVFLALTQMISKGKVTSEELRRQLGDRLPGAFNIFADAIGVSTAELDAMMKAGDVLADESNLIAFADQLNDRFGPQLQSSLKTTTTLLGKFSNEIFQARLRVGDGGFIESFNEALREMISYFRSREGRDFFLSLGAALGRATDVLTFFIRNMDLLILATKGFIALKLYGVTLNIISGLTGVQRATLASRSAWDLYKFSVRGVRRSLRLMQAAGVAALGTLRGLRTGAISTAAAFRAARSATEVLALSLRRIPVVLLFSVAAVAVDQIIQNWIGGVDDVTQAVDEHRRVMEAVVSAYESAKNKASDWVKSVEDVSIFDVEKNFTKQLDLLEKAQDEFKNKIKNDLIQGSFADTFFSNEDQRKVRRFARELYSNFDPYEMDKVLKQFEELNDEINDIDAKKALSELRDYATAVADAAIRTGDAAVAAEAFDSTLEEVDAVLAKTGTSMEDLTGATNQTESAFDAAVRAAKQYQDALSQLRGQVSSLKGEMKQMQDLAAIDQAYASVVQSVGQERGASRKIIEAARLRDMAKFEVLAEGSRVTPRMFDVIHGHESFRTDAYDDGYGTMTIGYGSTRINGRPVQAGDSISRVDAMRQAQADMERLIAQIDAMVDVPLSDSQLTSLVSYAYNAGIGSLERDGILDPLNRGDYAGAQEAIRNGVDTSNGQYVQGLRNRREKEAAMFGEGLDSPEVLAQKVQLERELAKTRADAAEATKTQIADNEFEIEQQQRKLDGKEREAFIEAELREARQQNPYITEQELAAVRRQAEEMYKLNNALTKEEQQKERIAKIQERISLLEEKRTALQQLRELQAERGDIKGLERTDEKLDRVNQQLLVAIQRAREFWQSVGGPEAEAALARLDTLEMQLRRTGDTAGWSSKEITELMAGAGTNAFDKFAQAIANGENAIVALRDAFLQFASDFLIQIGRMLVQAALLRLLAPFGGWVSGGMNAVMGVGMFHDGGIAGSATTMRAAAPSWFAGATRYHSGGIAGLRPDEVPAILRNGEEVLTENDPRHRNNGGASAPAAPPVVKVVNAFDSAQVVSEGLNSATGEQTFLNIVRSNASTIRDTLGIR
ncbi:glycoside hydrolase family protein [Amorphus orientalis]|uniref:Lysozyme n=1 Tax=Amorphus orientalis TaxID=649198 RepID=A0AAE3VTU0_9HYPH|nr:tape measure protein [Amorphus orientalis]MDQ0317725.1 tape measure domain-containing protein [Amorphus orientalis]